MEKTNTQSNSVQEKTSGTTCTNITKMDFLSALERVGSFGFYQKLLCVFAFFNLIHASANYCIQIFIMTTPKHLCRPDNLDSPLECRFACHAFDSSNGTLATNLQEEFGQENPSSTYNDTTNNVCGLIKQTCANGWDYDFSEIHPTFTTELNWVCDESWRTYAVHTAFWIGSASGFLVWGLMADRFGRRRTLYVIYIVNIVSTITTVLVKHGGIFTAARFFAGSSMVPAASLAYTLSVEYVGPSKRSLIGAVVCFGWMSGFAGIPWVAYFLRNWRITVVAPLVMELPLLISLKWVPESASWLLTCGMEDRAKSILSRISKLNSISLPSNFFEKVTITTGLNGDGISKEGFLKTTLALMKSPVLRKRTLILLTLSFLVGFYCNGNILHVSKLGFNFFLTYSLIGMMELPGSLYSAFLLDKVGRRWSCFGVNTIGGLSAIFLFLIPNKSQDFILIFDMVVSFTFITSYNMLFQFAIELFPTSVRARGYFLKRLFGELGSCVGSMVVYLTVIDPLLPQLAYGIMCSFAAFLVLFLPETTNQSLPITIAEGETFGVGQSCLFCPITNAKQTRESKEHQLSDHSISLGSTDTYQ